MLEKIKSLFTKKEPKYIIVNVNISGISVTYLMPEKQAITFVPELMKSLNDKFKVNVDKPEFYS